MQVLLLPRLPSLMFVPLYVAGVAEQCTQMSQPQSCLRCLLSPRGGLLVGGALETCNCTVLLSPSVEAPLQLNLLFSKCSDAWCGVVWCGVW